MEIDKILFEVNESGQIKTKSKMQQQNLAFEILQTKQDLNENSTMAEINQTKDNELIKIELELANWQKYKASLQQKIIAADFGEQALRELDIRKAEFEDQIKILKTRKSELEDENRIKKI